MYGLMAGKMSNGRLYHWIWSFLVYPEKSMHPDRSIRSSVSTRAVMLNSISLKQGCQTMRSELKQNS